LKRRTPPLQNWEHYYEHEQLGADHDDIVLRNAVHGKPRNESSLYRKQPLADLLCCSGPLNYRRQKECVVCSSHDESGVRVFASEFLDEI